MTGLFTHENYKGLANAMQRIVYDQFEGSVWAEMISAFYDGTKRPEWEFYVAIYGSKEIVAGHRKFSEKIIIVSKGGNYYLPSFR